MKRSYLSSLVLAAALGPCVAASAETLSVNASAVPPPPAIAPLKLGQGTSPSGHTIAVTTQYLTLDGKPWLPVMGEFHYTRFPSAYWEEQLLKMKAAGVNIVSTYVIWQHHQDTPDRFDFTGDRDLRAFIQLCQKHGLLVYLRPGPWAHAEVRFGGIPDFVVDKTFTRSNDPQYLAYVKAFFDAIGDQSRGLLWKDGGPVIGIQIENEYNRLGPLQGREHIAALKALLLASGFDVPLYSVTGWDNAVWPQGEAIPVFGSYVDEPWATSTEKLPPKTSYAFQYGTRVEYGLGAVGGISPAGDADRDQSITPFFGAEYGAGVPAMYRRRPVIRPDDIASMVTTKIGSGVNLLGYYMFQGGQNPQGAPTREESTAIGGYNDLPKLGYDFGAPLGEYGQAHPVLNALKPVHSFLNSFGDRLAATIVYAPEHVPASATDLTSLRWSVRSDGKRGFVFVNNYVRQYKMAEHTDVRFQVKLKDDTIALTSVDIRDGDFFIWPVNFDLSGIDLAYATVQPVTRVNDGVGDIYVFATTGQVAPRLAFNSSDNIKVTHANRVSIMDGNALFQAKPDGSVISVADNTGHRTRILVITAEDAKNLSVMSIGGKARLIITKAQTFEQPGGGAVLRQINDPDFRVRIFPPLSAAPQGFTTASKMGAFQTYTRKLPVKTYKVGIEQTRSARAIAPLQMTGPANTATVPPPEAFGAAASWQLTLPPDTLDGVSDAFLRISYVGDVARLFSGPIMIDDQYFDGRTWDIGLKRYAGRLAAPFDLTVLPLREDAKIMLDDSAKPGPFNNGQMAVVKSVTLVPEYEVKIND